ncbi:helix-turn-helix domain-containing protein [Pseudonocardiaceae bacterium YIM PH 21723]|nr:helix-turn-helix domain-containing protein [Pseudonocardiaceae bacterium YIM PH 21723]
MPARHLETQAGERRAVSRTEEARVRYETYLFGPFKVVRDGIPLTHSASRRASARTLLKWFLLNPGVRIGSAALCRLLWPDHRLTDKPNKLHVTLHHLRHALEPELAARQPSTFIRSTKDGMYWFNFSQCWWIDVVDVERLFTEGTIAESNGNVHAAISAYENLLDYYEKIFLPEDLFDEVFDSFRTVHEVRQRTVQHRLLRLYMQGGMTHKVLPFALSILECDPYSEEASAAIVEVNLRQGNVLAAQLQFADHLRLVQRDLGANSGWVASELWELLRKTG